MREEYYDGCILHTNMHTQMHTFSEIPFLSILFHWNKDPMTCKCQVLLDIMDDFNKIRSLAEIFPIMYGTNSSET